MYHDFNINWLFFFIFILYGEFLTANGGEIRTAISPPEVNCDDLASSGYSEFNIEELVTIRPDGKPEKDGMVSYFQFSLDIITVYYITKYYTNMNICKLW